MQTKVSIPPLREEIGEQTARYIDQLTKPQGSLGTLESLAIDLAKMTGETFPTVLPAGVIVFAADHGITEEGVSAYPQEVTAQMVRNFLNGGAAINVFSQQIGAKLKVVNIGVATDIHDEKVVNRHIRKGTRNFLKEDAMTLSEVEMAIDAGYEEAVHYINEGIKCLIVGEMGIGNTTSSSALLAALTTHSIESIVGYGTGITEEQRQHKVDIIHQSLHNRKPNPEDALDLLAKVGGLEIAAMTGAMLAAAEHRVPILVDGFICTVSACLATLICPDVKHYMIVAHQSVEPGHQKAIAYLKKEPLLNLSLRLGEGTGAAIAFPLLQFATNMVKQMATFSSAGVSTK
ncbi:nicotinate-nucleotide--dimethylbenzimidazole phosphoribosyltransferase [Metabacillus iocasae]|uniref:Nicotinate-nucleotide--dimethylbenzimidazole phosphoribosyltransferase n=1 Tax=Priestia iocasae TaxID=2291674 RepID=A0ABS2QXK0_9BACI|nr:nicotinate-nucleotide--dimethylbenzimidazole phosphoribosyltransferase [Metabacillus iocasae]MBM7703908.1 nicotinate-nucleotide--dimethylbenzimidazole phosphoribosyltransferase [Metabacillus iocasae]